MAEDINLNKEVFNKEVYTKTINTSFNELGVQSIEDQVNEQPTVQEFFNLYNELFYQIPEVGDTNSHEFLIKTSRDYINFEEENETILALQNEISNLRREILETQQELALNTEEPIEDIPDSINTTSVSTGTSGTTGGGGGSSGGGY
jgi:uncharacterized membrane protein YgcG